MRDKNPMRTLQRKTADNKRDPFATEVIAEQEAEHRRDMRRLSDLAFTFLSATDGDREAAAELFEQSIDLLCEGGTLQMYRYRAVLTAIAEGL
jgi:hypothetical protein